MNKLKNKIWLTVLFVLPVLVNFAQEVKTDSEAIARYKNDYSYWLMIAFFIATVLGFIYAAIIVTRKTQENTKETSSLDKVLNNSVAIDDEHTIMLDHEYDGIRELDNHLPPWWLWLFYICIAFSVIYIAYYHLSGVGASQAQEYEAEMLYAANFKADLEKKMASEFDEKNVQLITDAAKLEEGKTLYNTNCAVCHREDMGGNIGPNLVDEYWIHGNSPSEIYQVLKNGVLDKGMLAWKDQMTPYQMQNILSYIVSKNGSKPTDPKEPQGVNPNETTPVDSLTTNADTLTKK